MTLDQIKEAVRQLCKTIAQEWLDGPDCCEGGQPCTHRRMAYEINRRIDKLDLSPIGSGMVCAPREPTDDFVRLVARRLCQRHYSGRSLDEYLLPHIQLWQRMIPEARAAIEDVLAAAAPEQTKETP